MKSNKQRRLLHEMSYEDIEVAVAAGTLIPGTMPDKESHDKDDKE